MEAPQILERLAAHRTLAGVPREQLEWLVANGHERVLEPGDILTPSTGPVKGLYIVLDGYLLIRVDGGAGPRIVMEWRGGDVTGNLPYSRIRKPPGNVVAEKRSTIFMVDTELLPRLIRECPELTAVFVHVMIDRARVFKSSELLDEKMASLGRLAAGLAHEMNNPASAVARSAKTLVAELAGHDEITRQFCSLRVTDGLRQELDRLRLKLVGAEPAKSALEVADRQDSIDAWLGDHGISDIDVRPLVEASFDSDDLESLHSKCENRRDFIVLLTYVSSEQAIRQLVAEIEMAATRIHSLVAAVKGFTYVNQQATLQPIAIGRGLSDTVTVLRSKARQQSVDVSIHVPDDLPAVDGYGGELNQVWANLLDNAIDATPNGHVRLEANSADSKVTVSVIDDGPGIPPEVASRIFDPFFTTKGVGKGTGLGLDIARRIVQRHHGTLDMSTGPRGTEFRVTLPLSTATSKS